MMLRGNGGSGLHPRGLVHAGRPRARGATGGSTVLGTDGFIEIRKNIDIAGRPGGSHLFLVDQKETRYIDCADVAAALRRATRRRRAEPDGDGDAAGALSSWRWSLALAGGRRERKRLGPTK